MRGRESYTTDIAVIGAGAAGMTAAITAARMGVRVTLIEGTDRVGKKILSTGNGKCNLTNLQMDPSHYYGSGSFVLKDYFKSFSLKDTFSFFRSMGLLTRDRDGYVYPYSEQASTVLDCFRKTINSPAISLLTETPVDKLTKEDGVFMLYSGDKIVCRAGKVILSAGGCAAPSTGSDGSGFELARRLGLETVPPLPALVKLKSDSDICKRTDGVRAKASVRVMAGGCDTGLTEYGEIQFTKDGLSGIPIFNLSGRINRMLREGYGVKVILDLLHDLPDEELEAKLDLCGQERGITAEEALTGIVNKKIMLAVMKRSGISPETPIEKTDKKNIRKFVNILKNFEFTITSSYGFDNAQVCSGGVDFSEVSGSLETYKLPGLYLAGEILDIDGECGGYNLEWAWTSGAIAGREAAETLKNENIN